VGKGLTACWEKWLTGGYGAENKSVWQQKRIRALAKKNIALKRGAKKAVRGRGDPSDEKKNRKAV